MNTEKQALENAAKQTLIPATRLRRLYAGYDKLNELLGEILPISNASKANIDLREQAKAQGGIVIEVDHSPGSLTGSNALAEQINQGNKDVALGSVTFNGAAANAERMANRVDQATGGQGVVYQSTHKDDPVGTMIGGNAPTGGNDTKFPDSHGAYTGFLPPEFIGKRENDLRGLTDRAWGPEKVSTTIPVLPTTTSKTGGGTK